MESEVSNWTGMFEDYFLGLPYILFSTNGLENSRKILAVSTQLKQLQKESLIFHLSSAVRNICFIYTHSQMVLQLNLEKAY